MRTELKEFMLKQTLQQQKIDIACYIFEYTFNIKNIVERELLTKIIFEGKPKVRYISWDYNWGIKQDFQSVCDALIHLSGITIELNMLNWKEPTSIYMKNYIVHIFKTLKDGLIAYGCLYPPYTVDVSTNVDTIKDMSIQIMKMSISNVASSFINDITTSSFVKD